MVDGRKGGLDKRRKQDKFLMRRHMAVRNVAPSAD